MTLLTIDDISNIIGVEEHDGYKICLDLPKSEQQFILDKVNEVHEYILVNPPITTNERGFVLTVNMETHQVINEVLDNLLDNYAIEYAMMFLALLLRRPYAHNTIQPCHLDSFSKYHEKIKPLNLIIIVDGED